MSIRLMTWLLARVRTRIDNRTWDTDTACSSAPWQQWLPQIQLAFTVLSFSPFFLTSLSLSQRTVRLAETLQHNIDSIDSCNGLSLVKYLWINSRNHIASYNFTESLCNDFPWAGWEKLACLVCSEASELPRQQVPVLWKKIFLSSSLPHRPTKQHLFRRNAIRKRNQGKQIDNTSFLVVT